MGRILVGIDGSEHGDAALRWAVGQARESGDSLEVLVAWTYPAASGFPLADPPPPKERLEGDAAELIESSLERVGGAEGVEVVKRVVPGPPHLALVEASERADLLVVGTGTRNVAGGKILGSVSEYCVAHAVCPVTVVPS